MPRPKIEHRWVELVREFRANNHRMSATAIHRHLGKRYPNEKLPSERTIARYVEEFEKEKSEVRQQYEYFSWPNSALTGVVPWEASQALLELLRHSQLSARLRSRRIDNQTALWFWRVTQAAPGCPIEMRYNIASQFRALESGNLLGELPDAIAAQWFLAYRPWESFDHAYFYRQEVKKKNFPFELTPLLNYGDPIETEDGSFARVPVLAGSPENFCMYTDHFALSRGWLDDIKTARALEKAGLLDTKILRGLEEMDSKWQKIKTSKRNKSGKRDRA